jgi:bifunctional UDP-N-acetylglucosamine pyrophosphorylase/glucosamine-1-phosphate N-acetyltransferase
MKLAAVILAAGKGTRMKSKRPKVMHTLCGQPMLSWVMDAVTAAGVDQTLVVAGHGADQVARQVEGRAGVALQAEQLGTAHALLQAGPYLKDFPGQLLVLCGDTPLIEADTLLMLVQNHRSSGAAATVLTTEMADPAGYGRVIRDARGRVGKIVEHKDAAPEEKQIKEVNTGIYCFEVAGLFDTLGRIAPANVQGECYLTDVIEMYVRQGKAVNAVLLKDPAEVTGINDRSQLAEVELIMRRRVLGSLMESGVSVVDPASTFVDHGVVVGRDTVIQPFTMLQGRTVIGEDCVIGPGSRICGATVGNGVTIQNSIVVDSLVGDGCSIGPFSYLRPGTRLEEGVKVGDFVEIKKSLIGKGSKVPHLSYVGDATLGQDINIGAGTITCNYDGCKKWPTRIGDGAFIGSNTNLVAPVEIGAGAVTGAGSTITKNVPAGALAVERADQKVLPGWALRRQKK